MDIARGILIALICAIIIVLIFLRMNSGRESFTDAYIGSIISAIDMTVKNRGSILTFHETIGDPDFSPLKFAQMMNLHSRGQLTFVRVRALLNDDH